MANQTYNENYYDQCSQRTAAAEYAEIVKDKTSTFSRRTSIDVTDSSTIHLLVVSDNHNNIDALIRQLYQAKSIPNCFVVFLGDQAKVSLKDTKTPPDEAKTLKNEVESTIYAILASGIDKEKIIYIDGNHEKRVKDATSLQIGELMAAQLGVADRYARQAQAVTFELKNPLGGTINVPIFASHGQGRGGGPGAEADKSLNSNFVKGARLVLAGDTHKIVWGSQYNQMFDPGVKGKCTRHTSFANCGTDLSEEYYLQEKGIPVRAIRDGEILRLTALRNNKNECEIAVDFMNIRQILDKDFEQTMNSVRRKIEITEAREYKTPAEVDAAYKTLLNAITKENKVQFTKKAPRHPKVLRILPLSAANIGEAHGIGEQRLQSIVDRVKDFDNTLKIILNGDMVYYKKANLLRGVNFPEETLEYITNLADILRPVKDKIIGYNAGENERKIMNTVGNDSGHAKKLAELAMERLQLDENLAYEPMSKTDIKTEAKKRQTAQVIAHNKEILDEEYKKVAVDFDEIIELARFEKAKMLEVDYIREEQPVLSKEEIKIANAWEKEKLKTILASRLTKEGKLLDDSEQSREYIKKHFPLDYKIFRQPHKNLVQNILCKCLEIQPRTISMNSDNLDSADNYLQLTNSLGHTQGLNIVTSYKKGTKNGVPTRKTTETHLTSQHNGADVYVSSGQDYMTIGRTLVYDSEGSPQVKDIIHISGGRLNDISTSCDRIFEIRSEIASVKRVQSGLYEDTDQLRLTCANIGCDTIDLTEEIQEELKLKAIEEMFYKSYDKTQEKTAEYQRSTRKERMTDIVEKSIFGGRK